MVPGDRNHIAKKRNAFVVFTQRDRGNGVLIRPISARCMHKREVESYEKTIPTFKTDKEAEDFVATADLTNYDLSGGEVMRFELKRKDKSVNLRLPAQLLEAVQNRAKRVGVP
jgi:predicted DNA binding CopG/RHH family protein